jgi:hypothetical protein
MKFSLYKCLNIDATEGVEGAAREGLGLGVHQFESVLWKSVVPKPGAVQPGEGSPIGKGVGDPPLRLKSGCAQEDDTKRNSN